MKNNEKFKTRKIADDFDLEKIASCGQCFRVRRFEGGIYRFVTGEHVLYIQKQKSHQFAVSCDEAVWNRVWVPYFDLGRSYSMLRETLEYNHPFVKEAVDCGCGLRVLRQDSWEMLITFILSQRKNIPAIAKAVEELASRCGTAVTTDYETLHLFPTPVQLLALSEEELNACNLGYRTSYVLDAAGKTAAGELDLAGLSECSDEEVFDRLIQIRGVGKKVANCVCLFGYGRTKRAPVDVWIQRAIEEQFQGVDPFEDFGDLAGIIQQYIFYYEKNH